MWFDNPVALEAHARLATTLERRVHQAIGELEPVPAPPRTGAPHRCRDCGTTDSFAFSEGRKTHCKRCRSVYLVNLITRKRKERKATEMTA